MVEVKALQDPMFRHNVFASLSLFSQSRYIVFGEAEVSMTRCASSVNRETHLL